MSDIPNIKTVKAVVLVGSRDFGRCPLASRLNRAKWPILGRPAIQHVLDQLSQQGIERFVVSAENSKDNIESSVTIPSSASVNFRYERLPRGPAGCIYDAASDEDEFMLVIPAGIVNVPNVHELLSLHSGQNTDMTVFLNPPKNDSQMPIESRIYLCHRNILDCIPKEGYFDLKEGLVPALVHAGKTIGTACISQTSGNFRNWRQYLTEIRYRLLNLKDEDIKEGYSTLNTSANADIWVGENVYIDETAKLIGPLVIGNDSIIGANTIIFGPSVLGDDVTVGAGTVIEESVVWDHAAIGHDAHIKSSLVDFKRTIKPNQQLFGQIAPLPSSNLEQLVNEFKNLKIHVVEKPTNRQKNKSDYTLGEMVSGLKGRWLLALSSILVLAALVLSYWDPTIKRLWRTWLDSDEYSSGLLVPIVSFYVIWLRRNRFLSQAIRPCLWGLLGIIAAQGLRYLGLYYDFKSLENFSFVLSIGAIVLFVFGDKVFRKFIPIFLFLFLMLPLPNRVEDWITLPLQDWATISAVFCLETLGFSVIQEGNIININGTLVAVAEACNGLRMLTAFVVVSGLMVLVTHRKWWEKGIVLISSIPIALICNTVRLTVTAYFFTVLDTEIWEQRFHDFGGFAMMPVALLMIIFELWLLSKIVFEPKIEDEQIIYRKKK